MDYKEKYNKLVEAVKVLQKANPSDEGIQNWINDNVPELSESDDERIRKALIRFHKSSIDIDGIKGEDIIAWLEKQGEQKPERSEDDERLRKTTIAFLKDFAEQGYENAVECIDWLKSLKQRLGGEK